MESSDSRQDNMKTIMILAREHEAIRAIASRLEHEFAAAREQGTLDGEAVDRLLGFFEHEVDGHHQEKEERAFLPRLISRASFGDERLLRTLLQDHAFERKVLDKLRGEVEGAAYGDWSSTASLVRDGRVYLCMQREHSRREEDVLFPLARRLLSAHDDLVVMDAFRGLDHDWGGTVWAAARALERWLDQRRSPVAA